MWPFLDLLFLKVAQQKDRSVCPTQATHHRKQTRLLTVLNFHLHQIVYQRNLREHCHQNCHQRNLRVLNICHLRVLSRTSNKKQGSHRSGEDSSRMRKFRCRYQEAMFFCSVKRERCPVFGASSEPKSGATRIATSVPHPP